MSNNKIFLDSSILVEYVKGAKTDLLDYMLNDANYTLFISQIVVSEFYFHALAAYGNKAPLTLKTSKLIGGIMHLHQPQQFLRIFDFLKAWELNMQQPEWITCADDELHWGQAVGYGAPIGILNSKVATTGYVNAKESTGISFRTL